MEKKKIGLREFEGYEAEPVTTPPAAEPPLRIPWKRRDRRKKKARPPVPAAVIKRLAFESVSLAHADIRVDCERSLSEVLDEWPPLAAAWVRGQLLRNLQGFAGAIMTVSQSAKKLGFENGQELRQLLDTDNEINDLWEQTRLDTVLAAKRALVTSAKAGNQAAIRSVEVFLRDEVTGPARAASFESVPINQLAELFLVARQTIHEWYTKQGLPRNTDGHFDLATTIKWWQEFNLRKLAPTRGAVSLVDQGVQVKNQRALAALQKELGELLDRPAVINRLVSILQSMIVELDRLVRDIAPLLANKPITHIDAILTKFRAEFIQKQRNAPEELRLPDNAATAFMKFYRVLCPDQVSSLGDNVELIEQIGSNVPDN